MSTNQTLGQHNESSGGESFFYPHGGIMIWMFVVLELLVFLMAFGIYFAAKANEPNLFLESQAHLNQKFAAINTLVLISSGYLLALAVKGYEKLSPKVLGGLTLSASALGVLFIVIKFNEYKEKLDAGFHVSFNSFFEFYWVFTLFHAAHVVLGIFLLMYYSYLFFTGSSVKNFEEGFSTSVIYWHMCDIIWILLFPILYLL